MGPYTLWSGRNGDHRATTDAGTASPPAINARTSGSPADPTLQHRRRQKPYRPAVRPSTAATVRRRLRQTADRPPRHARSPPADTPTPTHQSSATRTREPGHHDGRPTLRLGRGEIRQSAMRYRDTLRPAGRARRVNHIRRVVDRHLGDQPAAVTGRPDVSAISADNSAPPTLMHSKPSSASANPPEPTTPSTVSARSHHCPRACWPHAEPDSPIDRHIRRASLGHRPHGRIRRDRPWDQQSHDLLGADAPVDQPARQPIRALIQLAVGQT